MVEVEVVTVFDEQQPELDIPDETGTGGELEVEVEHLVLEVAVCLVETVVLESIFTSIQHAVVVAQ